MFYWNKWSIPHLNSAQSKRTKLFCCSWYCMSKSSIIRRIHMEWKCLAAPSVISVSKPLLPSNTPG